jgi:hypothetical protein
MAKRTFEDIMRAAGVAAGKLRRDHLPASPATASIVVPLDATDIGALDAWIADQPAPKPSREEAARRLLKQALARK